MIPFKEKLLKLFRHTLECEYTELEDSAASYRAEREGETLFLFFEKSNGAEDWRNNLDFPAKPYREMDDLWFVHRGFLRVFKALEPVLAPMICDSSVQKIVLSGYSHGAALCLLAHEYAVFHRPEIADRIEGYGFGCPRVVWGKLNRRLKKRFEHFIVVRNRNDAVTHLPPAFLGYHHVGTMISIGDNSSYSPIDAHRPESYLLELSSKRGGEE